MPICHCPECIHCGALLFLWLLLSPPLDTGDWDSVCRVTGLQDGVTDDLLAEACFLDGVLHGRDLFCGMIYLGMAGCSSVCSSSSSPELSVDDSL